MHQRFVGKRHQLALERVHHFFHGAAPKVYPADAACKKRVAGKELRRRNREIAGFVRQVQADAPRGVAGRVKDARFKGTPAQNVALAQHLVYFGEVRRGHAEEGRLHIHGAIQRKVFAVHHHGRASVLVQLAEPTDVINVGVGAHDGFHGELVASEEIKDAADFIARINNQGFTGDGVADDRAIAVEYSHGDGDVDHSIRSGSQREETFFHERDYSIGD